MFAVSHRLAAFAALAGAVALMPLPALAAAATAAQNVNVHSGPAVSSGVVGQLQRGDSVDISKCQGVFCYVTFGGRTGWVSASYLTRDSITKARGTLIPETQVATSKPALPPPVVRPTAPQIASTQPRLAPVTGDAFPPAYHPAPDDRVGGGAGYDVAPGPAEAPDYANDPGYGNDAGPSYADRGPGSRDDGDVIPGTDVERPKADIPGGLPPVAAEAGGYGGSYDDMPGDADPVGPLPSDDWNSGPDVRWRQFDRPQGRFAALDGGPGRARACFFGDGADGGRFCLGAGQSRDQFGNWGYHIAAIQNPRGLRVTICGMDEAHDCRVYDRSGPVQLPGDGTVASISVDAPGGY